MNSDAPQTEAKVLVITDPARDRYASQRLIPWWEQGRLAAARVLVAGAGALGNEVLKNLALLGVGQVFVVDFDRVEMSNLTRSVLFRADDVGRPKAATAAARVTELNRDVRAYALDADVTRGVGLGLFRRMDVVLGCLDNRAARWAVNRACWRLGKPWVDGALDTLSGSAKVFVPPEGACYECGLTERDRQLMKPRFSCSAARPEHWAQGRIPTTVTSAALIAAVQVQEALKLLHGRGAEPGTGFIYDGTGARALNVKLARRADCLAHGEAVSPVVELDAGVGSLTLGGLLDAAESHLGAGATVALDRQLIVRLVCAACGEAETFIRVFDERLLGEDAPCTACGGVRFPDVTHTLDRRTPGLDARLDELGFPPLHIFAAANDGRTAYLELTADAASLVPGGVGDEP